MHADHALDHSDQSHHHQTHRHSAVYVIRVMHHDQINIMHDHDAMHELYDHHHHGMIIALFN